MKKLLAVLLLLAMCIPFACAEEPVDLSTLELTMPTNTLSEPFETEGSDGEITVVEPGEEPAEAEAVSIEPFIPDDLDKCIIGSDDRVQVTDTKKYPYSAIANMKVTGRCGCQWECTGFMVGKRFLMTAAHCMICTTHNQWANNVTFYFGYKSNSNYLYKYTGAWEGWAGTSFPNGYDFNAMENDWCYVKLDQAVGDKTGWLGFNIPSDGDINSRWYEVAGYRDNKLKYAYGFATAYDSCLMHYTADDVPGNSGGPIFLHSTNAYDTRADGIIVAENEARQINIGRRISSYMWQCMQRDGYQ